MHKRFKAFTLIELLVVIAIVGILSGFIFVSMSSAVNSAKDAKRKADLSTISKAILAYMAENNNAYPYTASTSTCNLCNNDSCTNPCTGFYANIQPYLSNIPLDPNGSTYYTYTYSANLKNEINFESFVTVYEINVKKSTNDVASTLSKKEVLEKGINLGICKSSFTLQMVEENFYNINYCPLGISVYENKNNENFISYKKYKALKNGDKTADKINESLKNLIIKSLD
jgi:type II secretion system protein G